MGDWIQVDDVKKKKHDTSLTSIVTKTVYGVGFGSLTLISCALIFLAVCSDNHLFKQQTFDILEGIVFFGCIGSVIFLTIFIPFITSKKIKKNGQEIINVTEKIKAKDLDYEISYGGIKEINQVLDSINDMRMELKKSLESQWRLENNRRKQISVLAHDFKTPMTVLRGNMDLLKSSSIDDSCREYIEDSECSLEMMEKYLNMLLEITRAERGYTMNFQKVELISMINDFISPLAKMAEDKSITISASAAQEKMFIYADKLLFQRMINNLIFNALDFTEADGTINIRTVVEKDSALISVTDSGCGFSLSVLKHGKEQFYMDDTSRGRENHYGLGLFIADCIVRQHKGTMELANDEQTGGAKITISIPLIKE